MKALLTIAGSSYDATVNSCYAIIKNTNWTPEIIEIFYSERLQHRQNAEKAKEALAVILSEYLGNNDITINLNPFDEYNLDKYYLQIEEVIKRLFNKTVEISIDITCGKKIISGIMLKAASMHKNKIFHIYCVYVKSKAYFDRWFPLRPVNSQDIMDLLSL